MTTFELIMTVGFIALIAFAAGGLLRGRKIAPDPKANNFFESGGA